MNPLKKIFVFYGLLIFVACSLLTSCSPKRGAYYRIRRGDTLYKVSRYYNVDVKSLMTLNEINDPTDVKVGKTIYIPRANLSLQKHTKSSVDRKRAIPKSTIKDRYVKSFGFHWPLSGKILTSFSQDLNSKYDGINIEGKYGQEIKSIGEGSVLYSGRGVKGYGNMIIIKHKDGIYSLYALNSENLVSRGESVLKSQVIAKVGGIPKIGKSFLHFQIRNGKKAINPLLVLK